jgi:hypothetical protein
MKSRKRLFAARTSVTIGKSRGQIEDLVTRHGATSFASGHEGAQANILFKMKGRRVRFELQLTEVDERENMRRWRCLYALLKAKLTAVEDGLATFEEEFLAFTLVPGAGGETVAQWIGPQLAYAYEHGSKMPPLLGAGDAP